MPSVINFFKTSAWLTWRNVLFLTEQVVFISGC